MMRYFVCVLFLFSCCLKAQQETFKANLDDIAPPTSPAFVLMDITPSNIVTPINLQSFSIQTLSAFTGNSNDGLSNNNYAVEVRPYSYIPNKNEEFLKYHGIRYSTNSDGSETITRNIFVDSWRKASVSLALMDGTFEVFERPQSYVSIGARTRLLKIISGKDYHDIMKSYKEYEAFMLSPEVADIMLNVTSTQKILDSIPKLKKYQTTKAALKDVMNRKPLFVVDIASAYSHFMGDESNNLGDGFGRFGAWLSTDLALHTSKNNANNYFHLYGVFRYLRDRLNFNVSENRLFTTNTFDFGGKVEMEWKKLSISFEYIAREGDISTSRTMGTVRYAVTDKIALNGGFGENFMSDKKTITIFGIQWGLESKTSLDLPTPPGIR